MSPKTRTLNLLALVCFASSLFMRATDPVIPQIASGLGVEATTAALLTTAYTLPYALVQPVLGALADVFNKARVMLLCLFLVSAATFVCGFAPRFDLLIGARILAGMASGGVVPIVFALCGDEVPINERQVAMGRLLFALMTGNLLGSTCAGIVIAGFGIGGALYGVSVSRLLKALGERRLMQIGGFVMGACLIVIALRLSWPVEFVNFAVLGFGFYMLHAVIQIYASELSPKARGSAMALHSFFFFLGQALGPIVYGIGHDTIGIGPVLIFGAVVLAGVGLTCASWLRRKPETAPSAV